MKTIKWGLAALLLSFSVLVNAAVVHTVCSSGCDFISIQTAIDDAGTADADIIELQENIVETVTLNVNIAAIRSDATRRTWDGTGSGSSHTLEFQDGLTQLVTITNIKLTHSSGNANVVKITSRAAGQKILFEGVEFDHSSTSSSTVIEDTNGGLAADEVKLNRCLITGTSGDTGFRSNASTIANAYEIKNSIFHGMARGIRFDGVTTNSVLTLFNNTIEGTGTQGFEVNSRGDFKNNVFANNTSDINFIGSSNVADLVTNAFEQQTDTGGFGADNIFGITSTDEFVDETTDDFHVKNASSQIFNSGTTIGSVTEDFDQVSRPQGSDYDIGAYELESTPTPTITPTFTITPTITPTPTHTNTPVNGMMPGGPNNRKPRNTLDLIFSAIEITPTPVASVFVWRQYVK